MHTENVECPSGFTCAIRELQVREEDLIANPKNRKSGRIISKLLDSVTLEVIDWGIYEPTNDNKVNWDSVLLGDRFYLLYKIRIISYGNEYEFDFNCPFCEKRNHAYVDLESLDIKKLPEESKKILKKDGLFPAELPRCGKKVWFKLLYGRDEKRIQTISTQHKTHMSRAFLNYRVAQIKDVSPAEKMEFLKSLSVYDANYLRKKFDEVDCGVDTEIKAECIRCSEQVEIDAQFDQNFFFPNLKKRRMLKAY